MGYDQGLSRNRKNLECREMQARGIRSFQHPPNPVNLTSDFIFSLVGFVFFGISLNWSQGCKNSNKVVKIGHGFDYLLLLIIIRSLNIIFFLLDPVNFNLDSKIEIQVQVQVVFIWSFQLYIKINFKEKTLNTVIASHTVWAHVPLINSIHGNMCNTYASYSDIIRLRSNICFFLCGSLGTCTSPLILLMVYVMQQHYSWQSSHNSLLIILKTKQYRLTIPLADTLNIFILEITFYCSTFCKPIGLV